MSTAAPVDKLDRAIGIAANVAYLLVVAGTLYLLFPGVRRQLKQLVDALMWNYRLGLYLTTKQPVPRYVKDAFTADKVADVDEHGAPSAEG